MNKFRKILLFLVVSSSVMSAQNANQGFEGLTEDNWNYKSNIPFYAFSNNTDLWNVFSASNGRIDGAYKGVSYMAGRDLDNPYSESVSGESSPEHILTFDPVVLNGAPAEVSFRLNYAFLDKNDYIYYDLVYNNGTSWNSPDVHVDVFKTSQNGNFFTNDWQEFSYSIPSGKTHARLRIVMYQNGNGYIGLDNFQLLSFTLSTTNNIIDGFSFGPNPVNDVLKLRAKVILDKAVVYDIFGKKIINQNGNSREMILDMSNLSSGIYLTKVESNGLSQTIKVIKK